MRSRINVNPTTAAVTVTTDPGPRGESLPTILKGVPVELKALNVTVDRPEFQFNPTNCAPMSVTGSLGSSEGITAGVSSPFQVSGCSSLPFTPKLTATAGGAASKVDGASLNVKIQSPGLGQANIQKVLLTIPSLLPSRLDTIQKACPDYVFEKNPATCDEGSVVGKATVHTPVFKNPLIGPAYLVSHANREFPDVDFVLQGEGITLIVTGHTDITHGVTYSRFETAPDAPFTAFETELPTGPHSALTAYVPGAQRYNLCGQNLQIPTEIIAQDGAEISQDTQVALTGCPPSVKVTKTKTKKASVAISISLSAPGSVTITGKGLKSTAKKGLSAGNALHRRSADQGRHRAAPGEAQVRRHGQAQRRRRNRRDHRLLPIEDGAGAVRPARCPGSATGSGTRASGAGATVRRSAPSAPRAAWPQGRRLARSPCGCRGRRRAGCPAARGGT